MQKLETPCLSLIRLMLTLTLVQSSSTLTSTHKAFSYVEILNQLQSILFFFFADFVFANLPTH